MGQEVGSLYNNDSRHRRSLISALSRSSLVTLLLLGSGCIATGPREWFYNGCKVGPNYCPPPAPSLRIGCMRTTHMSRNGKLTTGGACFKTLRSTASYNGAPAKLDPRVLGARARKRRAQQAIAAGNLFPQSQEAFGQYSRVGLSKNAFNNPAALLPPGTPAPPLFGNFYSDWQTGFNLSWELDFWGRFRRAIESANANVDASEENYNAGLVTLLADIATNYVQYRVAQQRIHIAEENLRIQQNVLDLAEQRFKVGTATRLDVEQARTILEQTRSTIPAPAEHSRAGQ